MELSNGEPLNSFPSGLQVTQGNVEQQDGLKGSSEHIFHFQKQG